MEMTSSIRQAAFKAAIELHPTTPPVVLALMMALIEDQLRTIRLDGYRNDTGKEYEDVSTLFNSEDAATFENWVKARVAPDRICDECGQRMSGGESEEDIPYMEPGHLFTVTSAGFISFFLCEWCLDQWMGLDNAAIPNICGKLSA